MILLTAIMASFAFSKSHSQPWQQLCLSIVEYQVSSSTANFDIARRNCESISATLVMIQTEAVQWYMERIVYNQTAGIFLMLINEILAKNNL